MAVEPHAESLNFLDTEFVRAFGYSLTGDNDRSRPFLNPGALSICEDPNRRPWRAFWPPKIRSELYEWLSKECPDAITWRFNPETPFVRPWHRWAKLFEAFSCRTQVLSNGGVTSEVAALRPTMSASDYLANGRNKAGEAPTAQPPQRFTSNNVELDSLRLETVTPQDFHYLADLDLYKLEKPFHSRLPYLNGLKRTNIVAQSYQNVSISDISQSSYSFLLDTSGFEYIKAPVNLAQYTNDMVESEFLPRMSKWLQDHYGCRKAYIYTYNVRCF